MQGWGDDVLVTCSDASKQDKHVHFGSVYDEMLRSIFCLVRLSFPMQVLPWF